MSRGAGKVEQAIIEATGKEPGVLIPLWEIARDHGYDPNERSTQHSWRRAATNLEAQGEIDLWWVTPSSPHRRTVAIRNEMPVVGRAASASDEADEAARLRCGELLSDWVPYYRAK